VAKYSKTHALLKNISIFQAFVSKSVMDELKRIIEESEVCSISVAMKNMNNVC
jgi:adenine-specific DNA methylase